MRYNACKFQRKEYYDEPQDDGTIIRYPYYSCSLDIDDIPCPFPARHCRFREQQDTADELIAAANGDISTEAPKE